MLVATHNGSFHADEVTACVIFKLMDPNVQIIRSRNLELLEQADYVIDVSGKFDLEKHFDHHPKDFTQTRANGIKYATTGLIWAKFGRQLLRQLGHELPASSEALITDQIIDNAWQYIDHNVMEFTDLGDNGQLDSYTKSLCNITTEAENNVYQQLCRFYMYIPSVPYLVAMQNNINGNDEEQYPAFMATIDALTVLYKNVFKNTLLGAIDEAKVLASYDGSEILRLEEKLPWFEAVMHNWDMFANCKLAMYPNHNNQGFRLQSLPASQFSRFENRCKAPLAWRGKEGAELDALAGTKSATFIHKAGFTGGANTKEDIEIMARNWIAQSSDNK